MSKHKLKEISKKRGEVEQIAEEIKAEMEQNRLYNLRKRVIGEKTELLMREMQEAEHIEREGLAKLLSDGAVMTTSSRAAREKRTAKSVLQEAEMMNKQANDDISDDLAFLAQAKAKRSKRK